MSNNEAVVRKLFNEQRWQDIVEQVRRLPHRSADLDFYYGSALAQLSQWALAREIFWEGHRLRPSDKRFPTELAGVAFKQKDYKAAKKWLRLAVHLDPGDTYVNDFLATIYFLDGNTEAALKYWNRLEKPQLENVRSDPPPHIQPALLDRAFAFAPASTLLFNDYRTTKTRIEGLGVFPTYSFELAASEDGGFDVSFHGQDRSGFGANRWQALLATFSGVFYQTVYPEYYNLDRRAINIVSLLRWDDQKRRAFADASGPLWRDTKYRWHLGFDLRNENWDIRSSFTGPAPLLGALNLRREAANAGITSFNSGRWTWSAGAELSHRDFRNVFIGPALSAESLLQGFQLKQMSRVTYALWAVPERRFALNTRAESDLATLWSTPRHTFEKIQGEVESRWFPQDRGDDYETSMRVRGGKIFGQPPFDELFMLGLERDNDLELRAHIGTRDGKKGSAPLGKDYFLSNFDIDKNVYNNGLLKVKVGPFLDTGKMFDALETPSVNKWQWDTGLQATVSALGVGVVLTYGKDLRSGNNAFYVRVGRR